MPCSICTHVRLLQINADLLAGRSFRQTAAAYKVDPRSLQRHKRGHLPQHVAAAKQAEAERPLRSAEWQRLRQAIIAALEPYPEAKMAVLVAISEATDEPSAGSDRVVTAT